MRKFTKIAVVALVLLLAVSLMFGFAKTKEKVLYSSIPEKIKGFDPTVITDLYTATVGGNIFEGLFQYKYLSDIYELEPCLADGMPAVSKDNLTYTFKIKKNISYYDPEKKVFKNGKGRAVVANDFVYTLLRLGDPNNTESGGWWLFDGFIKGFDVWRDAAEKNGAADYSKLPEGVKIIDNYTFSITLNTPYPQILYCFAMTFTWPVAKEVVDVYGEDWINHPIGTGPYALDHKQTIVDNQFVLTRNPYYRNEYYPREAGEKAKSLGLLKYAGKKLPFIDKLVYYVIEETNPAWLKLMAGELDIGGIPKDQFAKSITPTKDLTPELKEKGLTLDINPTLDVTYTFFNMEDPILGKNRKLRQAISMAQDRDKMIQIFYNNRAIKAQTVIPPGLGGYDPKYVNPYGVYNVEKAKQLIAEAGYPEGKGLPAFMYTTLTSTTSRQMAEFNKNNWAQIGIVLNIETCDWPTFLSKIDTHQVQIGGIAWGADYPDAQNFLQLLYGPNKAPGPNSANYDNPEFNALYDQFKVMGESKKRNELYSKAAKIAAEDCPWVLGVHRESYSLVYNWVLNYFFRDIGYGYSKYRDIDMAKRDAMKGKK
ncbi:MAG: hypothetical protein KBG82_01200 [Spirochaetes bacterium]|nr:hypothetical protein [Spirochaetota bacterium]